MQATNARDRAQTRGEEIANALSHGLGLALAIAALPLLVLAAARRDSAAEVVGACLQMSKAQGKEVPVTNMRLTREVWLGIR